MSNLFNPFLKAREVSGSLLEAQDVTEEKQAEKVFCESPDWFRAMADALPVLVWQCGTDKLCTYFNKRWLEFTGRTMEQELGNGCAEGVHPDDFLRCLDSYTSAFDRREPFVLEYRLRHCSGEYRWILDHGAPQFSSDGTFLGYIGGAVDTHDRKRVEDALRQSEERFRLLAEGATDYASFILDPEGRIMSWNPGAEHVKGYRTEEIIGRYFACFYPQEDVDRGKPEQILRIAANEGRVEDEGWCVRNDGSRFWAHVVITALRDEDGRLRGFSKVTRNASDRRQADEAIQRSVGWLHSLIETTQDAVISIDRKGRVVLFNPAAERIFGYSKAEIQGQKVNILMAEPYASEHDGYVARYESGGEPHAIGRIRTVEARRKSGEIFPIELSVTEVSTAESEEVHYAAFIRDISEVRRGQAWLQSLIETTQDAVLSIDRQGRIVLFNPAAERIFGYARNEIVGQKVNVLMADPYSREHDGYIERYEKTGEARAIGRIRTVMARRKSGKLFPIELSVTEIAVDQDFHYAAFIRDISEKVQLQEQLVENERLATIGTTAAKIGHELANPLNGMSLTIQLLEQRLITQPSPPNDQVKATIKRLKDEISRLNQLASQFHTMSRKEKYDLRPTEITGLIEDIIEDEELHFAELSIQVNRSIPTALPVVDVDRDKIKQVLLNLIKNAAEAMPAGGTITIDASTTENTVLVEITDTGTGIALDVDPFEPFTTTKKDGTGLGLVIVRQILTAHRGKISYRSRPGEGTTFRIELPQR